MRDFYSRIEEIEKLIDLGELDEAKEKVYQLMGEVNINLNDLTEQKVSN